MDDKIAFAYLNEIKELILKKYSVDELLNTNGSQLEEGKEILLKKMKFYNSHPVTTSNGHLLENLNLAKEVVIENIETLLDRDNKMTILVQKTDDLKDFSNNIFSLTGDISKRESERKNRYAVVVICLFIVILILIYIFAF